jgi:nucleoside-diphosphate-sugar epimerase
MKKILITGANSYVGCSVENWLKKWPDKYHIDSISLHGDEWRSKSFAGYDVVYHVAGIAHVSTDKRLDNLYYSVNRDLAIETAKKAKVDGVKQFIFMSSAILYGIDSKVGEKVVITRETVPNPFNAYGKSKLEADLAILALGSSTFSAACIRTPMVYGKNCKGNFALLKKYANKMPILPNVENSRSMIHIENLASFIKVRIDMCDKGVFYPQDEEYVSTNSIIETIRELNGKDTYYSRLMGGLVSLGSVFIPKLRKIYGNITFSKSISETSYLVNDFKTSIKKSI